MVVYIAVFAVAFTLLSLGLGSLRAQSVASPSVPAAADDGSSGTARRGESASQIQKNIAARVIRLHVTANSDSAADQALKLQVRDDVIRGLRDSLAGAASVQEARSLLQSRLSSIEDTAKETIGREGFSYPVTATLETRYFPVKVYGDLRFPAGYYQALCLDIGASRGHNWWCVLYPSLCFVDETYAVVPEPSKKKLKQSLSPEEYSSLEIHSALYDRIKQSVSKHRKGKKKK